VGASALALQHPVPSKHAIPPRIGTPFNEINLSPNPADPIIPGIDPRVLAQFGVILENPASHGAARTTADDARLVALPLGQGPQSNGWTIIHGPSLAYVDHRDTSTHTSTCLCWVVELQASHDIPCELPVGYDASPPATCQGNRHLVEFVDAISDTRWLSIQGHGLG
jgi:hypothetical protein